MIDRVNKISWFWSNKFKNIVFGNTKTFGIVQGRMKFCLLIIVDRKKRTLKKFMLNFKRVDTFSNSHSV